jgi:hypothetical protein
LPYLLSHIARDELNGRLHFRNHTFRFFDAIHAALTEPFVLGDGTDGADVLLDVPYNEFAVAPYAALQVDKVIRVANGTNAVIEACFDISINTVQYAPLKFEADIALGMSRAGKVQRSVSCRVSTPYCGM